MKQIGVNEMYKRIAVIGVGSLGGFFAESISKIKDLQTLILIDPDFVEEKNLNKSIYRKRDIGVYKVYALRSIIREKNENLIIESSPIEYIERKIQMPEVDLVVDCRDEIVSRCGEIDIRLYIAYRTLILDCKKIHKVEKSLAGKYIHNLNMFEISSVANAVAQLIYSGRIKEFINKEIIYQIPVDTSLKDANECLDDFNNCPDIVVDHYAGSEIIRNLHITLPKIVELNKTKALSIIVGEAECLSVDVLTVKRNEISKYGEAVKYLTDLTQSLVPHKEYYTVKVNKKGYIELLPETGAA